MNKGGCAIMAQSDGTDSALSGVAGPDSASVFAVAREDPGAGRPSRPRRARHIRAVLISEPVKGATGSDAERLQCTHRTLLLPPAVRADLSVAGPGAVAALQGLNGPPTLLMVMVGGQHDATEQADSKD